MSKTLKDKVDKFGKEKVLLVISKIQKQLAKDLKTKIQDSKFSKDPNDKKDNQSDI